MSDFPLWPLFLPVSSLAAAFFFFSSACTRAVHSGSENRGSKPLDPSPPEIPVNQKETGFMPLLSSARFRLDAAAIPTDAPPCTCLSEVPGRWFLEGFPPFQILLLLCLVSKLRGPGDPTPIPCAYPSPNSYSTPLPSPVCCNGWGTLLSRGVPCRQTQDGKADLLRHALPRACS